MSERNPDEIGALWSKQGSRGEYFTGTVDGVKVVVFRNTHKTNEKQPDFRVLKARRKADGEAPPPPEPVDDGFGSF